MTIGTQPGGLAILLAGGCAILISIISPALGQSPGEAKVFENTQHTFSVSLPAECRHEEGPGTIDAVCLPDIEQSESRIASSKLSGLVLQVSAETISGDAGKTPRELAERYTEAMFKAELPEAVCGESDSTRAKVQNVSAATEQDRVVYAADVVCSGVRFLQVPERRASVRNVIVPAGRYRLIARATSEEFEKRKTTIEAFFASFTITPANK